MDKILEEILTDGEIYNKFKNLEKLIDLDEFLNVIRNIDSSKLYRSNFHGLFHSQKVTFFAYLLSKRLGLKAEDEEILLDAAIYHDIGRSSENEDDFHGLSSTLKFDFLKTKKIYQNEKNFELLKAIVEGHCVDDDSKERIFCGYELTSEDFERYSLLLDILKDADALDRFRFRAMTKEVLDAKFLRFPFSKAIMDIALYVNEKYAKISTFKNYAKIKASFKVQDEHLFYHGIGLKFFNISSILDKGILCEARNEQYIRNYAGHNNLLWISAVDADIMHQAYDIFVKNGLYFVFKSRMYHQGLENRMQAYDKAMPFKSSSYDDEVFIFEQVETKDIECLRAKKAVFDLDIRKAKILNCNLNWKVVENVLKYYCSNLESICNKDYYYVFAGNVEEIKTNTIEFEQKSARDQKETCKEYLGSLDVIEKKINAKLGNLFYVIFGRILNTSEVRVGDILLWVLNSSNIEYSIEEGEEVVEIKFVSLKRVLKK